MVISVMRLTWRPVASSVPQTSILDPILFNIFINYLYDVAEHSFSKFAGDTKVGGIADRPEDFAAMCRRRDDRLEGWADLMKLKIGSAKSCIWQKTTPCGSTCWWECGIHIL